jgi:hypothetical protein
MEETIGHPQPRQEPGAAASRTQPGHILISSVKEEEMKTSEQAPNPEDEHDQSSAEGKTAQQQEDRPIPFELHYQAYQNIEAHIKEYLGGLDHKYYLVGLRISLDHDQSANEPGALPFTVEFGELASIDEIATYPKEPQTQKREAIEEEFRQRSQGAAIPFDQLKKFYLMTKAELASMTDEAIRVGISIVLTGSPVQSYVAQCDCGSGIMRWCCWDPAIERSICESCSGPCDL